MKRYYIIAGAVILLLIALLLSGGHVLGPDEPPAWQPNLTPQDKLVIGWQLGDDIVPYPGIKKWADCDDAALYSYLYLTFLNRGYDIKIYKGTCWGQTYQHVWLLVTENNTSYVYDWGISCTEGEAYKGRRITYKQLVNYVYNDL